MTVALLSLLAGVLTVLAPCVLPFLPVIVGGSLQGNKIRPYLVALALTISLFAFTLLLKASTLLLDVNPAVWTTVSGVLVILLGISMLFPSLWSTVSVKFGLDSKSHQFLDQAVHHKNGLASAILTGLALGPVFSSCSPTYGWVVATVLPVDLAKGLTYLILYCLGVAGALLAIALAGRKLIDKLRWAADPNGKFQKTIAVLFILVGIAIASGIDKQVQTYLVEHGPSLAWLENALLPHS